MTEELPAVQLYTRASISNNPQSKEDCLRELVNEMLQTDFPEINEEKLLQSIFEREALSTTGFGDGFAIPHGKSADVSTPIVAVFKLAHAVDWDAMDDELVDCIIFLIVPETKGEEVHLKLLSHLAYNLMDEEVKAALKKAQSDEALIKVIEPILKNK
ncbi:PTS sugar transporter subunit IIA [Alkalibacterium sp.]|nr:MAG: PTS sugar transporter subunit IIA [Alkalibacterium sp.]